MKALNFTFLFILAGISAAPVYAVTILLKYKIEEHRVGISIGLGAVWIVLLLLSISYLTVFSAAILALMLFATLSPLPALSWRIQSTSYVAGALIGAGIIWATYASPDFDTRHAYELPALFVSLVVTAIFLLFGPKLRIGRA